MSQRPLRMFLLSAVAAVGLTQAPGWAADPSEPMVTARAFAPLPAGASVSVEPRDDSDANLQLASLIAARLEAQLHPAIASAPLRLRFSTETVSSVGPRPGTTFGETLDASDRKAYVPTNLGYSEADRFLGGPVERSTGAIQNTYRLRATLETRAGDKVLWSGEARGALTDRNEARLAATLAEALAGTIGRTVETTVAVDDRAPRPSPTSLGALRLPYTPSMPNATPLAALPEPAERR